MTRKQRWYAFVSRHPVFRKSLLVALYPLYLLVGAAWGVIVVHKEWKGEWE